MPWVYDPHSGGIKIPKRTKESTEKRILTYAQKHYAGKFTSLSIRFRNQFCYIEAYTKPYVPDDFTPPDFSESREEYIERHRNTPMPLCRLRHFSEDKWSVAYYSYSKMKYDPCVFDKPVYLFFVWYSHSIHLRRSFGNFKRNSLLWHR